MPQKEYIATFEVEGVLTIGSTPLEDEMPEARIRLCYDAAVAVLRGIDSPYPHAPIDRAVSHVQQVSLDVVMLRDVSDKERITHDTSLQDMLAPWRDKGYSVTTFHYQLRGTITIALRKDDTQEHARTLAQSSLSTCAKGDERPDTSAPWVIDCRTLSSELTHVPFVTALYERTHRPYLATSLKDADLYHKIPAYVLAFVRSLIRERLEDDEEEADIEKQIVLYSERTGAIADPYQDVLKRISFWIADHDNDELSLLMGGSSYWICPDNHYLGFDPIPAEFLPLSPAKPDEWWLVVRPNDVYRHFRVVKLTVVPEEQIPTEFPSFF